MFCLRLLPLLAILLVAMPQLDLRAQDKGVTLKWKFEKDKSFFQKMTTDTNQTMKIANADFKQTQKQTFIFQWTPTKVEEKAVVLTQKIVGVQMDIDIGGQKITFDSSKEKQANNNLNDFFNALKDSEFTITLDPTTMKVTKVEGRQAFIDKLAKTNPQMKPLLDQILSEQSLTEMAEPAFAAVPGKEVKKGDTWSRESKLDMGPIGKFQNSYKYTYEGPAEKLEKIKIDSTLVYKEPTEQGGVGGLPFKIKSATLKSNSAAGTVLFDPAVGRVSKSDMSVDLKGELQIEIGGQTTLVDLTQTQKSTIETSDTQPK